MNSHKVNISNIRFFENLIITKIEILPNESQTTLMLYCTLEGEVITLTCRGNYKRLFFDFFNNENPHLVRKKLIKCSKDACITDKEINSLYNPNSEVNSELESDIKTCNFELIYLIQIEEWNKKIISLGKSSNYKPSKKFIFDLLKLDLDRNKLTEDMFDSLSMSVQQNQLEIEESVISLLELKYEK